MRPQRLEVTGKEEYLIMRKSAALVLAGGLATAAVTAIPEAEARPWGWRGGWGGPRVAYYGGHRPGVGAEVARLQPDLPG